MVIWQPPRKTAPAHLLGFWLTMRAPVLCFSLARSVGSHNELPMELSVFEGSWCAIVGAGSNNRGACTERCEFARTQPRNYNQSPLLRL